MLLQLVGFGFMQRCGESARCKLGQSIFLNATVTNITNAVCYGRINTITEGSGGGDFVLSFASDGQHYDALTPRPIVVTLPSDSSSSAHPNQSSIRWWWLLAAVPTGLIIAGCIVTWMCYKGKRCTLCTGNGDITEAVTKYIYIYSFPLQTWQTRCCYGRAASMHLIPSPSLANCYSSIKLVGRMNIAYYFMYSV